MPRPGIEPGTPGSLIERHNHEAKRSGPVRLVIYAPYIFTYILIIVLRFAALLHLVPGARMTTVGAQGRCNGNGVTKEPGNSRKHLIQMFHCRMEECSSTAKRSTNNQYVCKYIGRINDQSNWSGPFSLVVMTLD